MTDKTWGTRSDARKGAKRMGLDLDTIRFVEVDGRWSFVHADGSTVAGTVSNDDPRNGGVAAPDDAPSPHAASNALIAAAYERGDLETAKVVAVEPLKDAEWRVEAPVDLPALVGATCRITTDEGDDLTEAFIVTSYPSPLDVHGTVDGHDVVIHLPDTDHISFYDDRYTITVPQEDAAGIKLEMRGLRLNAEGKVEQINPPAKQDRKRKGQTGPEPDRKAVLEQLAEQNAPNVPVKAAKAAISEKARTIILRATDENGASHREMQISIGWNSDCLLMFRQSCAKLGIEYKREKVDNIPRYYVAADQPAVQALQPRA